jgi:hypothetical protein
MIFKRIAGSYAEAPVYTQLVSKDKEATAWLGDTYLITGHTAEVLTKVELLKMKIVN